MLTSSTTRESNAKTNSCCQLWQFMVTPWYAAHRAKSSKLTVAPVGCCQSVY